MRTITILVSAAVAAAVVVGTAGAAPPKVGSLYVEGGKGQVTVEIKGNVIGRLASGTVRVIDLTPRDRFVPFVKGRNLKVTKISFRTTLYKGQAIRFRMLGGRSKIVIRGTGISVSAVGRGFVTMDADRLFPEEDAGVYSLDGVDCSIDPTLCTPLPDDVERHPIAPPKPEETSRNAAR